MGGRDDPGRRAGRRRVRDRLGLTWCRPGEVLAARAGCSLVVALHTDVGRVVAKVTADDGAARSARALIALAGVPSAVLHPLRIPRLLLHDVSERLLVVEQVPGRTVADHLAVGDLAPMERTGRAVARLHAAPAVIGPRRDLGGHVVDLIRPHPRALASAFPELAPLIDLVLRRLRETVKAVGVGPVHRDLHPRQLVVQGDTVVLLDWDLAAHGDPAVDAGNLRAYLRHRQPAEVASAAVASFERGYAHAGNPAVLERAHVYTAFTQLRLAVKSCRLGGRDAFPTVRRLLDEAAALLPVDRADANV